MANEASNIDAGRDGSREPIKLGDRFEILPTQPLPAFDGIAGTAYAARALRGRKAECFALILSGAVPPRTEALAGFTLIDNPGIMRLLDHGMVEWAQNHRQALIFERPLGRRLMTSLAAGFEPMPEDQIMRLVIQSMMPVFKELSGRGLTHGGIRPNNMFLRDSGGGGLTVGECASTPPGYAQPALFEGIERAMAQPSGRGNGSILDDLYAFGVTLVFLALGRNPVQEMDDETVLSVKIERGSYAAIAGSSRIPQNLLEPVRGLLLDDPKQRWGLTQLDLWLSGRRLSPKLSPLPKRASRPVKIGGHEVWHCRGLARQMALNPTAATISVENGDIDRWLRRGISDDVMAEAVASAMENAALGGGKSSSVADRMVARVGMTLDPPAPIRYKGMAVMPDGLGVALAEAFLRREGVQPLAEMIAWQLPLFWATIQTETRPELVPLVQSFDTLRGLLEKTGAAFGVERVLYEMNPSLYCLSPIVIDYHAVTPPDLLLALDLAAEAKDRSREPMDRHLSAFLANRHKRLEDSLFTQLASGVDPLRRITALLSIFGDIQTRFGMPPLPGLSRWIGSLMEPTVARFYNRPQRDAARKAIERVASDGKLIDLLRIIDDPDAIKKDALGFSAARREHKKAIQEIEKLKAKIADPTGIIETSGRQFAAVLSSVIGTLVTAGLCFFYLFR
ncbi:MAG: serine/threonine protein kinase [Rhodospirillaceae bacterium]